MPRRLRFVLLAALVTLVPLLPAVPAAAQAVGSNVPRVVPGPVDDDFTGWAYAVPAAPEPGEHVNDVAVELYDARGALVGNDFAHAGRPYEIEVSDDDPDLVTIAWTAGMTARAERENFWAMPKFVELKDTTVTIGGARVPLGSSRVTYHRGSVLQLDDAETPEHDGIMRLAREFLACESDEWSIGQQTFTVDLVERGLHRHDRSLIEKGIVGLDWGTTEPQINSEGNFELHRDCDGKTVEDFGGTHHTTQWLESMGRAVYLLAASEWAGAFRAKIDAYIDHVELVATRLYDRDNFEAWKEEKLVDSFDNLFTHKTYMRAAGLGLASTLTDDPDEAQRWAEAAASITRIGIDEQWENGVNPERGGYDVQYEMYGVWLAEVYLSSLDPSSTIEPDLVRAIDHAIDWIESRVNDETGQIEIEGSTRVCAEINWWSGAPSEVLDTAETVRALLFWGYLQSDVALVDLAVFVSDGQKNFGNECPPPVDKASGGDDERPSGDDRATAGAGRSEKNDRSFDTPIGTLSNRRVLAAAAVALVSFVALTAFGLVRRSRFTGWPLRVAGALVVFLASLVALAA